MTCSCSIPPSCSLTGPVYKNECSLCFRVCEVLQLCLECLEAFCAQDLTRHSVKHPSHCQFLQITRSTPPPEKKEAKQPRLETPSKIVVPAGNEANSEAAVFSYAYKCTKCACETADFSSLPSAVSEACKVFISSEDASERAQRTSDAWTEPSATACEHSLCITQTVAESFASGSGSAAATEICCSECSLASNLWMCLTCGSIGCGRRQFDGSGGNGHAVAHFQSTKHPLAVKLGTILYRGPTEPLEADLYCYACDEAVLDPELSVHLRALGIEPNAALEKTEKSTGELQLQLNLTHTYSMLDGNGNELEPVDGPGRRGLINLGNSCYMASVLQVLGRVGELERVVAGHCYESCSMKTASKCLECQVNKLLAALESPSTDDEFKIKPTLLKSLLCAGHAEFSSSHQQDASEFLNFLLEERQLFRPVRRDFVFKMAQVLKCDGCGRESASVTEQDSLQLPCVMDASREELLAALQAPEQIERTCEHCNSATATKMQHLATLPRNLCVVANRLRLRNWVPEKVDCAVTGMLEPLTLESSPVNSEAAVCPPVAVNEEMLGELLLMGIEEEPARRALIACKNASIQAAMDALFSTESTVAAVVDEAAVEMCTSAGFERDAAMKALQASNGDIEAAMNLLLNDSSNNSRNPSNDSSNNPCNPSNDSMTASSNATYTLKAFITHQGSSMHCGHYVAHLCDDELGWLLFNDEKVAKAKPEDSSFPVERAYIYVYVQQQQQQ